jgi:hypothetical protein
MAAIVVVFEAPRATSEQYDQVVQELEAAGQGRPAERLCHVAAPTANGWYVVDVGGRLKHSSDSPKRSCPCCKSAG